MLETPPVTRLMKTLADPTRRAVFEAITRAGDITVGELVRGSTVSQPAVSQHLRALRAAGLVVERREGRNVRYRPEPRGLSPLLDWLDSYGAFRRERVDNPASLLRRTDP
jgi:DNA-binding transcriptional ArsR family regulator